MGGFLMSPQVFFSTNFDVETAALAWLSLSCPSFLCAELSEPKTKNKTLLLFASPAPAGSHRGIPVVLRLVPSSANDSVGAGPYDASSHAAAVAVYYEAHGYAMIAEACPTSQRSAYRLLHGILGPALPMVSTYH